MSDYHSSTKAMRPVLVKLGCSLVLGVATVLALPVVSTAVQPLVGELSVGVPTPPTDQRSPSVAHVEHQQSALKFMKN
jgi:hypothetical protein